MGGTAIAALWLWLGPICFKCFKALLCWVRSCAYSADLCFSSTCFGYVAEFLAPVASRWFIHKGAYWVRPKHAQVQTLWESSVLEHYLHTSCGELFPFFPELTPLCSVNFWMINDGLHIVVHGILWEYPFGTSGLVDDGDYCNPLWSFFACSRETLRDALSVHQRVAHEENHLQGRWMLPKLDPAKRVFRRELCSLPGCLTVPTAVESSLRLCACYSTELLVLLSNADPAWGPARPCAGDGCPRLVMNSLVAITLALGLIGGTLFSSLAETSFWVVLARYLWVPGSR